MSNLFDVIKNKMKKQNFYKGHMSLGGPVIMRENNGSDATWGACYYFYFLNPCPDNFFCVSADYKSIVHNSIDMFSLKTLYPDGIRTRVFCPIGGCDVHCAAVPSRARF
jgi:hypothetical protein